MGFSRLKIHRSGQSLPRPEREREITLTGMGFIHLQSLVYRVPFRVPFRVLGGFQRRDSIICLFPRGQFSDLGTLLLLLLPLPETTALKKADDSEIHSCSLNTGSMGQEEVSTSKAPPAQTFERVPKGPN